MLNYSVNKVLVNFLIYSTILLLGIPITGQITKPSSNIRESSLLPSVYDVNLVDYGIYIMFVTYLISLYLGFYVLQKDLIILKKIRLYIILILIFTLSSLWASNPIASFYNSTIILISSFSILVIYLYFKNNFEELLSKIRIALLLNCIIQSLFILLYFDNTIHDTGRWAGLTGSANFLGALSITLFFATLSLIYINERFKIIDVISFCISITLLIGSQSTTSLISVIVFLFSFSTLFFSHRFSKNINKYTYYVFSFILIFVASLFILDFISTTLQDGKTGFTGRDVIWAKSLEKIIQNPILGYGMDANTETLGVVHWATTFHNGFIEIAIKTGIISLIIFLIIIYQIFLSKNQNKKINIISSSFIIMILVYNITESSFFMSKNPLWILFLFTYFNSRYR